MLLTAPNGSDACNHMHTCMSLQQLPHPVHLTPRVTTTAPYLLINDVPLAQLNCLPNQPHSIYTFLSGCLLPDSMISQPAIINNRPTVCHHGIFLLHNPANAWTLPQTFPRDHPTHSPYSAAVLATLLSVSCSVEKHDLRPPSLPSHMTIWSLSSCLASICSNSIC